MSAPRIAALALVLALALGVATDSTRVLAFSMTGDARQATHAPVRVYHAGSVDGVMNDLGPGFTAATGIPFEHVRGPSGALADQMRSGEIQPDVYISADAETNLTLMGPENNDRVRWYILVSRQPMVIEYGTGSRYKADLDAAAAGTTPWYEVLQKPGFVLKRDDPTNDPGGYRAIFAMRLAEAFYGLPGFADRVLGSDTNEAQVLVIRNGGYVDDPLPRLADGTVDAELGYLTGAIQNKLNYITLPDEVSLANPALATWYSQVSYTNPQGQVFRATPVVYSATIPTNAPNPEGAAALIRYLASPAGQAAFVKRGYQGADPLVGGDDSAVPAPLRDLVKGHYGS